ncbi:hypothetical protein [Burkholderia pseudomallei]|uniref:hypothetical protein n=1 Tax=Burkholderia pseudomallei TaxID=28450 RepID=UPI000530C7CA|nr:hypothetical protein [Burkholderia pseudomallei]KGS77520.1 hypothetical protein X942_4607 [Burkholderia pseudomallei MSHR5596]
MKENFIRRARIAGAYVFAASTLTACGEDYRNSDTEPVFNQTLTDWLGKAALSPQVTRIDCYIDGGWFSNSLLCDVTIKRDRSRTRESTFEVRSNFDRPSLLSLSEWQFDTETLSDSKFRIVVEQREPAVLNVRVHADQSRVSLEDAEHLADKAIGAVEKYLRSNPTSDPQSLRDTWASAASQVSVPRRGASCTASATSTTGAGR